MLTTLDLVVLVVYLVGVAALGLRASGKQTTTTDYFLGGRDLPWWAVCFSVIATETSTLTVIGVPAVAYGGTLTFLQLAFGFLLGRIVVSAVLLPRYFRGDLVTAYAFLGERFGDGMRGVASVTFMLTRLLADGVRLFATAIPLKIIAAGAGLDLSYATIILILAAVTVLYTYVGGLRAVVWVDAVQMLIYVGGAIFAVFLLADALPDGWWTRAAEAGKTQLVNPTGSLTDWLTSPYALPTAVLGGAVFAMASHGADQLIVQRILACRSLKDGQRAMIGSGIGVIVQFGLFLLVGLMLWAFYDGATLEALGLGRGDEVFPKFIVEEMPAGISGLLLAGIIAAAMSTLSSSLNALAGASVMDVWQRFAGHKPDADTALRVSRLLTLVWGAVFAGFAMLFQDLQNPVVELGLGIAGFTYGGLLGAFVLGIVNRGATQRDALVAFVVTIVTMTVVIFGLFYSGAAETWVFTWRPDAAERAALDLVPLAWPLYTVFGVVLMVSLGSILGRIRGRTEP